MSNPYYNPEDLGLEIFFEDDQGGSYEFDMFVVWKGANGVFYTATDSGCSCPSPFEWASGLDDLNQTTKAGVVEAFEGWWSATPVTKTELFAKLFGV